MRYVSLFSGIESATQAWHPLGWTPVAFAEMEKFPSAVLAHHYPSVPNVGDVTKVDWKEFSRANGPVDLVVFGSPCQSFSVAGKRLGMDDPRGNLALHALSVVGELRPRWFIFENVPGLLSSAEGSDFGLFLRSVDELGYSACWRVLDAQYVRTCRHRGAVPQRRRRVFVVGYLGDWRRAAAVLFDRESLRGDPPPRREAGKATPASTSARPTGGGGLGTDFDLDGGLVAREEARLHLPEVRGGQRSDVVSDVRMVRARADCDGGLIASTGEVAHCLNAGGMGRIDYETETMVAHAFRGEGFDASEDGTGRGTPGDGYPAVAFDLNQITSKANRSNPDPAVHHTLPATSCPPHLATPWAVRRLTPVECERLQGFPDGYTQVPYRGKPAADGPRYKSLGNSFAVNVADWIGRRIELVDGM